MRAKGIDVSHWQGAVDWAKVKGAGIDFVFIKASEHTSWVDPRFKINYTGAVSAMISVVGVYHYWRSGFNGVPQAEHFYNTVAAATDPATVVLWVIDVEKTNNGGGKLSNRAQLRAMISRLNELTNLKPLIYTNDSSVDALLTYYGNEPAWLPNHALWVASYREGSPLIPRGFSHWRFWQYTDRGSVPGIGGNVDLDWYNGTPNDLLRYVVSKRVLDQRVP